MVTPSFRKRLLTAFGVFCLASSAFCGGDASWTDANGVSWSFEYTTSDYTAIITKGTTGYKANLVIPSTVYYSSMPFTIIGISEGAFNYDDDAGLSKVKSVVIPDSVEEIGDKAFYSCSGLATVTLGEGLYEIGEFAFAHCTSLTKVVFRGAMGNVELDDFAFLDTPWLENVNVNDNFADAIELKGSSGCTTGCNVAATAEDDEPGFPDDRSLWWKWTPPSGAKYAAFSMYGSDFNTSLGVYTGSSLDSLTEIAAVDSDVLGRFAITPGTVYYIRVAGKFGEKAGNIKLCWKTSDGFSLFVMDDGCLVGFLGPCPETMTIPDGVTAIGRSAFDNEIDDFESSFTRVVVPGSVKDVGAFAFCGCTNLTSVTLGEGVESIGWMAFLDCSALASIRIPDSVVWLWGYAFSDCVSLKSASLPRRFEGTLDPTVFSGCPVDLKLTYRDPSAYTIRFHRNDASDGAIATRQFTYGTAGHLPVIANTLNWARRGYDFKGWATSEANAAAGKVWKGDWATVSTAAPVGKTLDVWAVWALKSDSYAIQFVRNDGAGTWRTVGFKYGEKTRLPSVANGLNWARRGYNFKGWALTTANAAAGKVWKADWSYVATAAAKGKTLTVYAVWELKPGYYQIRFNKNDGTTKWRSLGFAVDVSTKLSTIKGLGWERAGKTFTGWATSKANASAGKVWKTDGATVKNAAAEGKTLSIYAIWE